MEIVPNSLEPNLATKWIVVLRNIALGIKNVILL